MSLSLLFLFLRRWRGKERKLGPITLLILVALLTQALGNNIMASVPCFIVVIFYCPVFGWALLSS